MSAGAQNLQFCSGVSKDALTQRDISIAAGHIKNPLAYHWIVYRYGGHETRRTVERLESSIIVELSKWAVQERWRLRRGGAGLGPGRLRSVAQLWIAEASHPRRCPDCRGAGYGYKQEVLLTTGAKIAKQTSCSRCGGNGVIGWSNLKRAQWVGMRHSAWQKTWLRRYERLSDMMSALEANAMRTVSEFLSEPLD